MGFTNNSEINFSIFRIFLPLSLSLNLFLLIAQLPFVIIWYLYDNTILGEGILVVPMIFLYFFLRYHFTKKKYPYVKPLRLSNNKLYIPKEITKSNQDIIINLREIKEIKLTCFEKEEFFMYKRPAAFRIIIYDNYNRVIEINALSILNVDKLINIFKKNNIKLSYIYDPILIRI